MSSVTATLALKGASQNKEDASEKKTSGLEAISQGMTLPGVPSLTSMNKKRRWMLEHLAGAFRVFSRNAYNEGMSGHISLRDPEHANCFWTNP